MTFYSKHVFFCENQRDKPRKCCQDANASEFRSYAKKKAKALGLTGPGKIRINKSGCLGRCQQGPCLVIYPDNIWYTYQTKSDIDEIIEQHLLKGQIVKRLVIPDYP